MNFSISCSVCGEHLDIVSEYDHSFSNSYRFEVSPHSCETTELDTPNYKDIKYKLLKEIVIPVGTILENIDGNKREYVHGNAECNIAVGNDATATITIGSVEDAPEWILPLPPERIGE
jgi:hypothetical protein